MSLIDTFVVQKWMRSRGWMRESAPVVGNQGDDDLQLIFDHLDATKKGQISLSAIRNALRMVRLSEDPDLHARLAEIILSCFRSSGRPGCTGGSVDFNHFAYVMSVQEQGREYQTLQDEQRNEGLAAVKAHFANIFRRQVIVRGLLGNDGAAGLMCSVFLMLFKTGGLATSSRNHRREVRIMQEEAEVKKARQLERKRAAQAKRNLLAIRRTKESIFLKRETTRAASVVPGTGYAAPSPPTTPNPGTRMAKCFRRRYRLGSTSSTSISTIGRGSAFADVDSLLTKTTAGPSLGGFVRHPSANVRKLRRRRHFVSPAVGPPRRGSARSISSASVNNSTQALKISFQRQSVLLKQTLPCVPSAIMGPSPRSSCNSSVHDLGHGRNGFGAGCGNGFLAEQIATLQEQRVRYSAESTSADVRGQDESPQMTVIGSAAAPATITGERRPLAEQHTTYDALGAKRLLATSSSSIVTTSAPTLTAVVPTATAYCDSDSIGNVATSNEEGQRSCNSSIATIPKSILRLDNSDADYYHAAAAAGSAEQAQYFRIGPPGNRKIDTLARRPSNPLAGKARGRWPGAGGHHVRREGASGREKAGAENRAVANTEIRRPSPNPWCKTSIVRCMRRPKPEGAAQRKANVVAT